MRSLPPESLLFLHGTGPRAPQQPPAEPFPPGFDSSLSLEGVQRFVKSHQKQGILPFDIALAFQDTEAQVPL